MDVQDNPHFVDLTVNNATVRFRDTTAAGVKDSTSFTLPANFVATKNGFRKFVSNYVNGEGQTTAFSAVLGGSFKGSDRVRLDLGGRYERDEYGQAFQNTTVRPVSGDTLNSLTLFDQDVWGVPSSYRHFSRSIGDWAASAGGNYAPTDQTSLYALGSRAYKMPALDEFLNASAAQQVSLFKSKRNWTGEVGVKHAARNFGVTLDRFYTLLKDIVSQGLVVDPITGQSVWIIQQSPEVRSYGLELEGSGHLPSSGFSAVTNWTWLRAEFATCPPPGGCGTGADVGTLLAGKPPLIGDLAGTYAARAGPRLPPDLHLVERPRAATSSCVNPLPPNPYFKLG